MMDSSSTVEAVLKTATAALSESGSESPSLDAAVLLCHALDKPRSFLLTWPEKLLSSEQQKHFASLLERRLQGEPVAYIIGKREFWSLPLMVSPSTLIPRPDTERLVELALERLDIAPCNVLDLGTGTGAIALAIASECPQHTVYGVDLNQSARDLALSNAKNLAISNVKFLQGSWFEPLMIENQIDSGNGIEFAVIVSNPPYIDKTDPHLSQGDVRFEPTSALVAEEQGLADIRTIADGAIQFLSNQGWLLFEHGYNQGSDVRSLLSELGYVNVATEQDYAGNDRVTYGQYLAAHN